MTSARAGVLGLGAAALACAGNGDVPAGLGEAARVARGAALFQAHCALCHGESADGQGARHVYLHAADLRHVRATPRSIFATIRGGKPGTSMPAWGALSDAEAWDLTAYLLTLGGT